MDYSLERADRRDDSCCPNHPGFVRRAGPAPSWCAGPGLLPPALLTENELVPARGMQPLYRVRTFRTLSGQNSTACIGPVAVRRWLKIGSRGGEIRRRRRGEREGTRRNGKDTRGIGLPDRQHGRDARVTFGATRDTGIPPVPATSDHRWPSLVCSSFAVGFIPSPRPESARTALPCRRRPAAAIRWSCAVQTTGARGTLGRGRGRSRRIGRGPGASRGGRR